MTTVTENYQANLTILGKLERGDMLAAAGNDGKLVRKTNWLTQATNKNETRGKELFTQIKDVLDSAVTKMEEDDYEVNKVLIKQYIKANKGLEILLSTYKSKGSKETELIGNLSLVLVQHMKNFQTHNILAPEKQDLKKYAEQAIQFVNDCRIRSVNNIFGNSYFGEEDTRLLTQIVRVANVKPTTSTNKKINHAHKNLKAIMATIIKMPCSRREKKVILLRELQNFINGCKLKDIENLHNVHATEKYHIEKQPEAYRIKMVKNAIRHRLGNCGEKARVVATHLVENTEGKIGIVIVSGAPIAPGGTYYDHAWVLISKEREKLEEACKKLETPENGNYKHLFPHDTWVVDGWTRDWWQLRAWTNSMCNPRQLGVRMSIRKAIISGKFVSDEIVTWPPKYPNAGFRLRFAHMGSLNLAVLNENNNLNITMADWHQAVQVLQSMKSELNALGMADNLS